MAAEIYFNDYAFHSVGSPQFGVKRQFESDGDGRATSAKTTITLRQIFEEESFSDNEARIRELKTAVSKVEGRLRIVDERGEELYDVVAKVTDEDVPLEWRQYVAEVTITFEFREFLAASAKDAQFTPAGGVLFVLPNVRRWSESRQTDRYSPNFSNRRETTVTISGSGRYYLNQFSNDAARNLEVKSFRERLRKLNSTDGNLTYAGETLKVKVDSAVITPNDGTDYCDWSFTASFQEFPDGTFADAEFDVSTKEDLESMEVITAIKGTIRSSSKAAAQQKAKDIRDRYSAAKQPRVNEYTDKEVDGKDGERWIEASFSYEFRSVSNAGTKYDLKVSTKVDNRTADTITTWSGSVRGRSAAEALSQARLLGFGKQPFMLTSEETVSSQGLAPTHTDQFVSVEFSYEYISKTTWLFAEVSRETPYDPLGDQRITVSGFVSASTEQTARSFVSTLQNSSKLRTSREFVSDRRLVNGPSSQVQLVRFEFSFSYHQQHAKASLAYSDETSEDLVSAEKTRTLTGVCYAENLGAAQSEVSALASNLSGAKVVQNVRTPSFEKIGTDLHFMSLAFTVRSVSPLSGSGILQAEYTLEEIESIDRAVITTIPFGRPHIQSGCGHTIGVKTVSGYCLAAAESAARNWGTGKKSQISGGESDPSVERMTYVYPPLEGNSAKAYRFEFTYSARFAD